MSNNIDQNTETLERGNGHAVIDDIEQHKAFINQARGSVEADITAIKTSKAHFDSMKDITDTKLGELQATLASLQTNIRVVT